MERKSEGNRDTEAERGTSANCEVVITVQVYIHLGCSPNTIPGGLKTSFLLSSYRHMPPPSSSLT